MRLIDADAIIKEVEKESNQDGAYGYMDTKSIVDLINDAPTADVQEVKHGNWVGIDDDPCETFECDRCGFVLDDWIQGALYNFCPNCGARMEGITK